MLNTAHAGLLLTENDNEFLSGSLATGWNE